MGFLFRVIWFSLQKTLYESRAKREHLENCEKWLLSLLVLHNKVENCSPTFADTDFSLSNHWLFYLCAATATSNWDICVGNDGLRKIIKTILREFKLIAGIWLLVKFFGPQNRKKIMWRACGFSGAVLLDSDALVIILRQLRMSAQCFSTQFWLSFLRHTE